MRMATRGTSTPSTSSGIIDSNMPNLLQEGPYRDPKYGEELLNASKLSYEVEMAIAYSSEKLANLEHLLLLVLSEETDIGSIDVANDDSISFEFSEKAFTVELLYSILHLELRDVDISICDFQDLISKAISTIYASSDNSTMFHDGFLSKLRDSEEMLQKSHESVSEMKIQLSKLQMNSNILRHDKWKHDTIMDSKEEFPSESNESRPGIEALEHRRVLRMLEKSLARELELEKKLLESKQNKEDLKSKNNLLEQVSASMEEAAQVAWSGFLEADTTSAVLMGISKDILEKFRISSFHRSNSSPKEEELGIKLEDCLHQLNAKESLVQELKNTVSKLTTDNAEVTRLREKVQKLEKSLETCESRLRESYSSNEKLENQIKEINFELESLREGLHETEIRAESAEEKVSELTDSNMELMEEIDFLKDTNGKKVGLLEEQLRELDFQFQQARASSEASLEQQHQLYTAIWDMETLIDELKQNVSKAEGDKESIEERNVLLSEKNEGLEKELGFLRAKVDITEEALNQFDLDRRASAKDICLKTGLIMDTVMQIGSEREHIMKKVNSLMKENKSLRKKLQRSKNDDPIYDKKERLSSVLDIFEPAKKPEAKPIEIVSEDLQVETSKSMNAIACDNGVLRSVMIKEEETVKKLRSYRKAYILMTIVIALLSILTSKYLLRIEYPVY